MGKELTDEVMQETSGSKSKGSSKERLKVKFVVWRDECTNISDASWGQREYMYAPSQ